MLAALGTIAAFAVLKPVQPINLRQMHRPDPLLGKWIGGGEGAKNPTVLDFKADGRVIITENHGRAETQYYRREPYADWQKRINARLRGILMPEEYAQQLRFQPRPRSTWESISVATNKWQLSDAGLVMELHPEDQSLYNPITAFFTRPGKVRYWEQRLKIRLH
jgi:hypothetical protein